MEELKLNEIIRAKRRERDLTQEELAGILGVTKAAVSKWETNESCPDIAMLPKIAQVFHITMDELFGYTLEFRPLKIVNEYHAGFTLADLADYAVLDHGTVRKCELVKCGRLIGDEMKETWEVRVQFVSAEDDFPYILQNYIRPGCVIDMYSLRLADGKIIDDDKPNKHFVCKEKVWEYRNTDAKYVRDMIREQRAMGLIGDDE